MPKRKLSIGAVAACLLLAAQTPVAVSAQTGNSQLEAVPEPPPLPPKVQSGETLEPDVTIIQRERETVHEYRFNGRLYAVRVVPENTPAYYLVDADGDGNLETRTRELTPDFLIPAWVLFSW